MRKSIGLTDYKDQRAKYDGLREYAELQELKERFQRAKRSLPMN